MRKYKSNFKEQRVLKQSIKSVPEKETDTPLLRSTVAMKVDPYGMDMLSLAFPLLVSSILRGRML